MTVGPGGGIKRPERVMGCWTEKEKKTNTGGATVGTGGEKERKGQSKRERRREMGGHKGMCV